jgi:Skp family chaperone for outer membrane proteins
MAESVVQHVNAANLGYQGRKELNQLLAAVYADLSALRTSIVAVTAKLDADATVTDTNYGALCNPAALNTSA